MQSRGSCRREACLIQVSRAIFAAAGIQTVELRYRSKEPVYERNARAEFVYVVKDGAVCQFRPLPKNRRSVTQFLFRGDGFGYETYRYHRDTAQALMPTTLLAASREGLLKAAATDLKVANLLISVAADAGVAAEEQGHRLRVWSATERVAQFLIEMDSRLGAHGEIALPMKRDHIAQHLGISHETVSRTITALHKSKIIECPEATPRRIKIRDKKCLQEVALDASHF